MMKNKRQAIKEISDSVALYNEYLCNRELVFIYRDKRQRYHSFKTVFKPENYLHLTGIEYYDISPSKAKNFYRILCKGRLTPKDFDFSKDGTTELKLDVLKSLMKLPYTARFISTYNNSRPALQTTKIAGSMVACIGFIDIGKDYMVPNTILNLNVRNLSMEPKGAVIAIYTCDLSNNINQSKKNYARTYLRKGENEQDIPNYILNTLTSEDKTTIM